MFEYVCMYACVYVCVCVYCEPLTLLLVDSGCQRTHWVQCTGSTPEIQQAQPLHSVMCAFLQLWHTFITDLMVNIKHATHNIYYFHYVPLWAARFNITS